MRAVLVISSLAMIVFWILVLAGLDGETLLFALFVIGVPSLLEPLVRAWKEERRGQG
jgi:hypothetical protein